ncbi:hypothetical protein GCM10025876_22650 [Demequina litorisediminis]|uniref:Uncharacterized protein n=1 Tax=Demequina litorisediminis TaxID=1849022 RepID=A0ABQ6IFV6_9MICO|nr:hypothetical protein GCM10025876_22650 [Demequina litorisediminis]
MAVNQADPNTSRKPRLSSSGPQNELSLMNAWVSVALCGHCGSTDPGIAAIASRSSRINATRIDVT